MFYQSPFLFKVIILKDGKMRRLFEQRNLRQNPSKLISSFFESSTRSQFCFQRGRSQDAWTEKVEDQPNLSMISASRYVDDASATLTCKTLPIMFFLDLITIGL